MVPQRGLRQSPGSHQKLRKILDSKLELWCKYVHYTTAIGNHFTPLDKIYQMFLQESPH